MPSSTPNHKTTFIVGAGASKEVGLPIGSELKKLIVNALAIRGQEAGDVIIGRAIDLASGRSPLEINQYHQACGEICNAMPQVISIDNYINQHRTNKKIELCGKLAIVHTILAAESHSTLFVDPSNIYNKMRFGNLEKTWFTSFWNLLTENCSQLELEQRFKSVVFVIFNYDRCIEHYLYHSLKNVYNMSDSDAVELVRSIEIYHPYGTVGSLPWQNPGNSIGYGATPGAQQLIELASQIKTFAEDTDERSSDVASIRSHMLTSPRIIFLGFAFHRLNMELLLSTHTAQPVARHIFGTAYEISKDDTDSICKELVETYSQVTPSLRNGIKCCDLFHEFKRSLSFA